MSTLSDTGIRDAIDRGELQIAPFEEENLEPASVDLTLGDEAFRASDDDKITLSEGDTLTLPPGEMALVLTREQLEVGTEIAGNIGLRSYFARKGIDLLSGPQVDPGFRGPLHIVLLNLSPSKLLIEYGEPFLTVEFRRLDEASAEAYDGSYQAQSVITPEEMRDLKEGQGIALSDAVKAMQNIARDVSTLQESVTELSSNADRYMKLYVRSIMALVGAVISLVVFVIAYVVLV